MSPADARPIEAVANSPQLIETARSLSEVSNIRSALAIARQWAVIAAAAGAAVYSGNPFVYVLAIIVIGSRQHALHGLMHEATHYRLFTNRFLNMTLAHLFCALPIGLSQSRYSEEHLRHHRAPNTDGDPYLAIFRANPRFWSWPKTKIRAIGLFVADILSLNYPAVLKDGATWMPWLNHFSTRRRPVPLPLAERLLLYTVVPGVAAVSVATGVWWYVLVLWLLPTSNVLPVLIRLRTLGEHSALHELGGVGAARDVEAHWLEKLLICPLNVNNHLTHHIFPSVPYHNLPRMHEALAGDPEFRRLALHVKTYLGRHGVLRGELIAG